MNSNSLKPIRSMFIVFVLLNVLLVTGKNLLESWNVDTVVLATGNLLVFVIVLVSYFLLRKAIYSSNPQVFVRAMYGSFMIKFFVLAIGAFIYIQVAGKNVNKQALFINMGLYFVYTFIEISALMKLLKQKKNA
ncbi:MAG TPA: hypothetical protein VFO70_09790 [Chitinophagaceae bacterium]|nr:hypothetical protein [Chitinophagaceae bacterium]